MRFRHLLIMPHPIIHVSATNWDTYNRFDIICDRTASLLHARADDVKESQTGHVLVVDALQHAVAVDVTRFRHVIRRATRRVILAVCQSTSSHDVTCKATLFLACTNNDGFFAYEHVVMVQHNSTMRRQPTHTHLLNTRQRPASLRYSPEGCRAHPGGPQ